MKKNGTMTKQSLWKLLDGNDSDFENDSIQNLTISKTKLQEYFPESYTKEQIEKVIFELLDTWKMVKETSDRLGKCCRIE